MAFDDDDFDWAAAIAEIDRACTRNDTPSDSVCGEPSSRAFHQKTLDGFVQGPPTKHGPSSTSVPQPRFSGRTLDPFLGNRISSSTGFRARNTHCDQETGDGRCDLPLDREAARIWIYPANVPHRTYQFDIAKSALFCNTLVCLPTGLGKTLIAAVVMYNFFRWFPTGKIVFAAPSRPLVVQQIEACHMVTGIPQNMTIDMTGLMNPQVRGQHWQSKRVFFVTPQVLEKDMKAGRSATKQIVCLVLDEAHRATGNYAYCVVVRELLAANVKPRILALTATPGSQQASVQTVVDNLRISCLEYRDENDPDVRQYTHSRKIEVIEVALNADCTRVKDVFIEMVQPIVQRLCYLGVFYHRDISKLTPYEFLTARDKFRQAPPQALQQSRYPEVENYFGLAITLFHVFKLLITHGMRAAYEMVRQKVEQGVLKKLAKNAKLCQVQDLMKQSIGHGAPNPKLEKVAEIVNQHFRLHDASNTRVIIFTNFRESVKDIIEKLGASCASVKAMEFIGQSSGKFSKGQSQKTQQAVLQRFRGGCYNTIVATSIAEEGLDIMEVDLVICFDANISPLRMIQRMGRTGRKRDGRVVVLASEGPEIQGYLRKQAKSKVLSKHMFNGGLQSFNFHPSDHMIPHSLQTRVQYEQLSIEDFIPRGRKLKNKHAKQSSGSRRSLSERELEMLRLIKELPDTESSAPSRAADPQNPVSIGPVSRIKHSKRSCLLMDVLQTLRMHYHQDKEEQLAHEGASSSAEIAVPMRSNNPTSPSLTRNSLVEGASPYHASSQLLSCEVPLSPSLTRKSPVEEVPDERLMGPSPIDCEDRGENLSEGPKTIPNSQTELRCSQELLVERNDTIIVEDFVQTPQTPQLSPYVLSYGPDLAYFEILNEGSQRAKGHYSHSCSFSNGIVSVSEPGVIRICSPPALNVSRRDEVEALNAAHERADLREVTDSGQGTASFEATVENSDFTAVHKSHDFYEKRGPAANNFRHNVDAAKCNASIELETNGHCFVTKSLDQSRTSQRVVSSIENSIFASCERQRSNLGSLEQRCSYVSYDIGGSRMLHAQSKTPGASGDDIQHQKKAVESHPIPEEVLPDRNLRVDAARFIPGAREPILLKILQPLRSGNSSQFPDRKEQALDSTPSVEGILEGYESFKIVKSVKPSVQSKDSAPNQNKSPNQNRSSLHSASSKEDWQDQDPGEFGSALGSAPRRRQFKRLLRVSDKRPVFDGENGGERVESSSAQDATQNKVHWPVSRIEKRGLNAAARIYIDEEAGISSDEANRTSSGNDDGENEDGGSLDSFIDTAATQHLNGSVNMMAIYRRSLLTPSPSNSLPATVMGLQHLHTTPDITSSSGGSPPTSASLNASLDNGMSRSSSHSAPVPEETPHTLTVATSMRQFEVPMTPYGTSQKTIAAKKRSKNTSEEYEDQKRPELRKRKLQFESTSAFDDDLFKDVDLDALEAEATAISRLRAGAQSIQGPQTKIYQTRDKFEELKSSTSTRVPSAESKKANDFQFFPSFDLGLDL